MNAIDKSLQSLMDAINADTVDHSYIYTCWANYRDLWPHIGVAYEELQRAISDRYIEYGPIERVVIIGRYMAILNDALRSN